MERGASLDDIITTTGFARNAAIVKAKEAANENDETRKRFEVMCRAVFVKFRSCITMDGVRAYRDDYEAIKIIYKSLDDDRQAADITDIIKTLHGIVDPAITTNVNAGGPSVRYDISKIDFERLRQEFASSPDKTHDRAEPQTSHREPPSAAHRAEPLADELPGALRGRSCTSTTKRKTASRSSTRSNSSSASSKHSTTKKSEPSGKDSTRKASQSSTSSKNPASTPKEIARIKQVAVQLLATLKAEQLRVNQWRDKEATRDAVRSTIFDFLYSDKTGLPETYTDEEIKTKSEDVFQHVFYAYPTVPSPIYGASPDIG